MAWLSVEIQERLSIVLAHFVWQGALIAALLAVTVSLLRVRRPNARYAASMVAFGLLMLSPVVTWFVAPDLGPRVERAVVEINEPAEHSTSLTHRVTEAGEGDATGRGVALPVSMEPRDVANVPIVVESPQPILAEATPQIIDKPKTAMWVERLRMWEPWIIRGWLTGVVLLSLRLLLGAVGLWRWRRAAEALPDSLAPVVARLCEAMQMAQPTVRLCRRVSEAVALGLFKPMILLPVSWTTELPPDMLEAVLAHELAHVRRFDLWVNLLQRLVETLLFYHPAVWWLSRRLRVERELCCDDLAATVTNNRLRYAETLEHVARLSQSTSASSFALAMASRDGALLHRVRQLLDPLPTSRTRSAWWIGLLTLTLVLSLGLGAFLSPQAEVEATMVPSPSQLERSDNDDDEFKPEPVDEEAIRLRAVGQTQFLQADYAAMAESYAALSDRNTATLDDHLWHGHAYQLARNWLAAVRAYHGALNKLDEQIAATEAELKVLEPKVKLDESIKFRKGNRYLPLKRDQEQLPKRWPSLVLLVGHLELDELKNPAAAAKTLSRGLRFSPELAVPLRELLSSAEAAVTRQPKSEDHIRGMQAIMPLETQRYLAMAQEQLDQPAGAFDTWSRVRLGKIVFPSSYATTEPAHLKDLVSKLPQDALQPHHRFVLEHPDREPLKPREAKDFLKVSPANPFQARPLPSVEFPKLGPAASSLVQLPDGRLLMAFASGDQHHIGIKLVSSRDGKEWDALWEFAHNSVFDTRAPSLVIDDDGVIWMLCLSKRLTTERFASGPYELWLTHSRDGREWSPLRPLQFEPNKREGEAPAEPKLAQGQYQELVQLTRLPNRRFAVFHGSFLAVADSPSGLRTLSRIPLQDDKRHVNNPHATFDSEGRCHLVFDDFGRGLYYTRSTDLREWSPPQLLGTNEKNSSISHPQLLLANERVALIHEKNNGSWLQRGSIAENGLHLGEAVQITDHLMPLNGSRLLRVGNQILIPAGVAPYFPKLLSATVAELLAQQDTTETSPPDGLEFLKPYAKLHGLSLDMTEPQFLEIVKQQELKTRKTVEAEKVTHDISLDDGHSLIVMFDKEAKCNGIQRVRGDASVAGWGEVIKGLRVRVVPVLASMDEDAVDLEKRVTAFETLDDVALAVEIENASDAPVPLHELRYGKNYGESSGKLASDWFGQFLFSIDYFDASGKRVERPELIPLGKQFGMSDSALTSTLAPKQSLKMLLRPNRWISALSQQPLVGQQRAVVRYRGAAMDGNDKRIDVVSPAVAFSVKRRGYRPSGAPSPQLGDDPKNDPELEPDITKLLVWGPTVNGLRAALDVVPESRSKGISHGTKPKLKLVVQNVSQNVGDMPVRLASLMWLSELPITAKNAVGEDIPIQSTWYTGVTPAIRVLLKPQQIVTFDAGNVGLAVTKERADAFEHVTHRRLVAPRGKYLLKGTERFGTSFRLEDGKGNVTFPTDSDFKGDLTTGSAKIDLSNEIIEGEIVDAVSSKPVEGTTVSFMVVKPKTATSDEVTVANLIWGPKSPSKIYFTIPEVPEDIAQRADRDELEVRFGVGNHPDYEDFAPTDRIPLKEFFHEGPKTAIRVLSKIKLTPKKKTAAVSFHLPEADQIEVERRFNAARKSIDRLTGERFEKSIDRLISESRDFPPNLRAGLMEKLMMEAHEWLGLEQAPHVGFDGTLFERVKHKCAMAGLARVDEVPAALTLRLLEFATASQLTMSTDSNPDWIAQRRLKTSMWLTQIERVRRVIDPNWDETDYPQITNGDIAPSDPQKRAEFEREVETNRLKAERYNEQITARRLLAQFTPRMEEELIRMYVRKPLDTAQFESLLQQHCSDPSQHERLAKTVRLFNSIIPGGTRLKYGWPDGLAEAGASGVPQLMEAVRDKTYPKFIRHDGTWALGLIGDPRALPVLIEVAQDESTPEKYKNIAREFANTLTMAKQNSEPSNERAQTEAVDPNGEIVGVLLDEQGQSVKGATIACGAVINDSGRGGGANDVTDANGRYRLKVPSPGIYNVWLKKFESPRMTAIADDGVIVEGGKVTTSRMVLMAGIQFSGTLVDEQGQAVPDVTVYCNSLARPASAGVELVKTNEKGVFTFSLPPGRAYFYAHRNGATPEVRDAAKAIVTVPRNGDVPTKSTQPEPFKLVLKNSQPTALDSPEWIERSTPGTQVIHQAKANDVTGTVVDENGKPVSRAKVFRYDGPILEADDKGEFKVTSSRGTQFIMHAFAPGYHVWTGTPYSGAVLKIVLEKKPVEVKAALQKVTVPKAPEGGSALTPRPATQGMRVDVPNGVHLELVGLSTIHAGNRDADQRQWWDARGGVIGNTPNVLGEKRWMRALPEYSKGREVVVRMTAHSDSPFVEEFRRRAAWIIGEVEGVKSTPAVRIEGQTPPLLFHLAPNGLLQDGESVDVQLHSHFIPTAGATTTRLRFGFGHAATSQTYDDKGKLNSQTLVKEHPEIWRRFGLLRIEAKPEGVVVWTKPTRGLGDLGEGSVQLLLVDGTILNSMSPQLSEHGDEEQHLFKKIDAADVDGVTLRVLTLTHWVTFSGLPLNAKATADAKAEVQTVAHNAEVASRIDSATVVPADAAEFLKMICKPNTSLRALRLGMNEVQFKAIMRECGIPMQTMRGDGSKVSYTIQTGYDRDILANFDNGKCEVIQPIPRAEWPKQVSFESLTVSFKYSFSGRPPEQITIKRNGDCFYQVDELPARGTIAKRPGARITSQVHPQRMLELERLLQETDWLVKKPDELPGPPRLHTEETPITVVRGGVTTTLKCVAPRDDLYRTLLWFLRGMAKQEQFIYAIDWNSDDATSRSLALHELRMDIEALEGQPGRSLPQYDLDYHRLLKTFGRILRNPNEQEDPLITAIKVASITREDSEFDAITRWRHDRSLNVRNVVAVAITEYAMGRKLSDRQLALLSDMVSSSEEARWGLIRLGDFAVPTIVKLIEPGSTKTDIVSEQMVRAYLDHRKELTGPFDARLIAAVQSALKATKNRPSQRTKYYEEFLKWIESQPVKAPATESR